MMTSWWNSHVSHAHFNQPHFYHAEKRQFCPSFPVKQNGTFYISIHGEEGLTVLFAALREMPRALCEMVIDFVFPGDEKDDFCVLYKEEYKEEHKEEYKEEFKQGFDHELGLSPKYLFVGKLLRWDALTAKVFIEPNDVFVMSLAPVKQKQQSKEGLKQHYMYTKSFWVILMM